MSKSGNLAALTAIFQSAENPLVFYAEDPPFLPRILIFYWPIHAVGSVATTSRIRTTILSAAGFKSFSAFSVSPSSAYYNAVHKLPEDKQRDEIYRGLAFSLCRYFAEIPTDVKNTIAEDSGQHANGSKWGQSHAAQVTCRLQRVTNQDEILAALRPFLKERAASPTTPVRQIASIRKTRPSVLPPEVTQPASRHGAFATPAKRVTSSSSRRTPSYATPGPKPTPLKALSRPSPEQLESLRFKMCEFVDTEDRYISRLQQLIELVTTQSRTPKSISSKFSSTRGQKTVSAMLQFPALLDQIRDLNLALLDDLESVLQNSEDTAMAWLERPAEAIPTSQSGTKDFVGIVPFAKVLLAHFPKFPVAYREYLDFHSAISSNLDNFLKEGTTSIQQAPSLLMEPAQRISRYGLYIDTMVPLLPQTSTIAIRTLEKARKIIAEICDMEPAASTIVDSLRIEHESKRRGGALSPTKLFSTLTRSTVAPSRDTTLLATPRDKADSSSIFREKETPRLLPSLSRSWSRKVKTASVSSRPLAEQDIDQANNTSTSASTATTTTLAYSQSVREKENTKPKHAHTTSSTSLSSRYRFGGFGGMIGGARPTTASSQGSSSTYSIVKHTPEAKKTHDVIDDVPVSDKENSGATEDWQIKAERLEQENYKLLEENAELKRRLRKCRCQGEVGNG